MNEDNMTIGRVASWVFLAVRQGGWPAIAVFMFHVVASSGFNAYAQFPWLDIPMHFVGGVAIAYFFHRASITASERGIIGPYHPVTHGVLVVSLTCVAAVVWEFAEFVADCFLDTYAQLGLRDTLADMFLGICGGIVLLCVVQMAGRRKSGDLLDDGGGV
jgi:hypothetical protein